MSSSFLSDVEAFYDLAVKDLALPETAYNLQSEK